MSLFDRAKFILTANAYKAGKLYSLKGHDIVFSRGSSGTRIDPSGNIVSVASNIPRINHTGGTSKILMESAATNKAYNSNLIIGSDVSADIVILNNALSLSGASDATYIQMNNSGNLSMYLPLEGVTALPNTQYTLTFYIKSISGNGTINVRLDTQDTFLFTNKTFTANSEWQRVSHTFSTNATASSFGTACRFRNMSGVNTGGEFLIWGIQLEEGSTATSLIPTSGTAQTRAADQPESFNPVSLGYLLADEGSIVLNNRVYKYTSDGNMETFIDGVSQGTEAATPPTSWTLPIGETERVLMFDYPLSSIEIAALL